MIGCPPLDVSLTRSRTCSLGSAPYTLLALHCLCQCQFLEDPKAVASRASTRARQAQRREGKGKEASGGLHLQAPGSEAYLTPAPRCSLPHPRLSAAQQGSLSPPAPAICVCLSALHRTQIDLHGDQWLRKKALTDADLSSYST